MNKAKLGMHFLLNFKPFNRNSAKQWDLTMKTTQRLLLAAFLVASAFQNVAFAAPESNAPQKAEQIEAGHHHDNHATSHQAEGNSGVSTAFPALEVHKSPTCGCCGLWVEHMEKAGFKVSVVETQNMSPIKSALGVPADLASCHTTKVGDYFVEGHVPAADVKRLLTEKPDVLGIGVPGMPLGSPGMEVPSGESQSYNVTQVNKDGSRSIFSSHPK